MSNDAAKSKTRYSMVTGLNGAGVLVLPHSDLLRIAAEF